MKLRTFKPQLTKKALCIILSVIIALGTFITFLVGYSPLHEWLGIRNMLSAYAAEIVDTKGVAAVDEEAMLADDHTINLENRDGSNTVYVFSEPISFTDENGDLKTKDITVEKSDYELKKSGYEYTNGQNDYRINFSKDYNKGIQAEFEGAYYSIIPQSIINVEGEETVAEYLNENFEVFQYKNIYGNGTNLRFYPQLNGVKDEIVLNQNINQNKFSFELKTKNCSAKLNEDGTISLVNKSGIVIQTFNSPYAYDSEYVEGDKSKHYIDCKYTLESKDNNTYIMTMVVPKEWLSNASTKYPVVIDPTTSEIENQKDAGVYSKYSTTNWGSEVNCCFGRSNDYGYGRVYSAFTMPSAIKKGATINSAYQWERETTGRTTTTKVTAHLVNAYWSGNDITWSNKPGYSSSIKSNTRTISSNSTDNSSSPYWYKFDIKTLVKKWADGSSNYGMVFVSNEETGGNYYWRAFAAKNYSTSSYRPYTVINYTNDTTAPTINKVTKNYVNWTNQNVSFTVEATDSGSGLAAKPYSFSTSSGSYSWQESNSKTYTTYKETVYISVRDFAGNIKTVTRSALIDRNDPPAPTVTGIPDDWTNQPVSATVVSVDVSADSNNGKSGVRYYSRTKEKNTYNWKYNENLDSSYNFNNLSNGTHYFYAKDRAGNISGVTVKQVKYDPNPPEITGFDVEDDEDHPGKYVVTITATDKLSGIKEYSINNGANPQSDNVFDNVTSIPNQNDIAVTDNAGNTAHGIPDIVPPIIYQDNGKAALLNPNQSVRIMEYKINNGEYTDYSEPFEIPANSDVTITARIKGDTTESTKQVRYDPIDEATIYKEEKADLTISNNDAEFDIARYYDSASNEWWFSTQSSVSEVVKDYVYSVQLPDKTNEFFEKLEDNEYENQETGDTLTIEDDNYCVETDELTYYYSTASGRLISINDSIGNEISFEYDSNNNLTSITAYQDESSHIYSISEQSGKLQSIKTPIRNSNPDSHQEKYEKLIYQYSGGKLIKVYYDKDTLLFKRSDDIIIDEYTYSSNRLDTTNGSTVNYVDGNYTSITTPAGETITDETEQSEPEADPESEPEEPSEIPEPEKTYFEGTNVIHFETTEYVEDGKTIITVNEYNNVSQLIKTTETHTLNKGETNEEVVYSCETTYTYFENSNTVHTETIEEIEDGVETTEINTYNENSVIQSVSLTQGGTTTVKTYTYYDDSEAVHTETVEETTNNETVTTVSTYDENGTLTSESYTLDDSETVTSYNYDSFGNIISQGTAVTKNNQTVSISNTVFEYDELNRCVKETTSGSKIDTTATVYGYNPQGEVIYEKSGDDVTRTLYDSLGRVVQEIEPQDYAASDDSISLNDDGKPCGNDSYSNSHIGHRYVYDSTTRLLTSEINRFDVETTYTYHTNSSVVATEVFDVYSISYNPNGKITSSTVNGSTYAAYSYDTNTGNPTEVVYGNGQSVQYEYDNNGNLWKQYHNNSNDPYIIYDYVPAPENNQIDTGEQLELEENLEPEINEDYVIKHKINYDSNLYYSFYNSGNVKVAKADYTDDIIYSYKTTNSENSSSTTVSGLIGNKNYSVVLEENSIINTYDSNILSAENTVNNTITTTYIKVNNTTVYNVTETENETSNVKSYGNGLTFTDNYNNSEKQQISSSSDGTNTTNYTYYADGQLQAVTGNGYSASYSYDGRGNLTEKTVNNVTTNYSYTNDRLTAVDNTPLTYDSIGNVLTYGNKSYTWSSGRNLAGITDGTNNYSYSYNKYGYRTSKMVNSVTTDFNIAEDGTIISQSDGTNTLYFEYTEDGTPLGFVLNDTQYLYITNNSSDVIAIADSTGTVIATYLYNEWGEVTVNASGANLAIANINPLRYRGYYYDSETGYYYLQSRYYDPAICRFINADLPEYANEQKNDTAGINIYVYCCNDAVNNEDKNGNSKYRLTAIGIQFELSASLSILSGAVGIEILYALSSKKIFAYWYYAYGVSVNLSKIKNLLSNALGKAVFSSSTSLKDFAKVFKINFSISIGFFGVFTKKKFSWPKGYKGKFKTKSISINKVKGYRSTGSKCKAYGICYSPVGSKGFCFSKTKSKYYLIDFNAYLKSIKKYLSSHRKQIKGAID